MVAYCLCYMVVQISLFRVGYGLGVRMCVRLCARIGFRRSWERRFLVSRRHIQYICLTAQFPQLFFL